MNQVTLDFTVTKTPKPIMRQWTNDDNAYLKQNAHRYSKYWFESIFGISEQELIQKCSELGVEHSSMKRGRKPECEATKRKRWHPANDQFLIENASNMTLTQLSEALNIARTSIRRRCSHLNISLKLKRGRPRVAKQLNHQFVAQEILSLYPFLLPGQIRLMRDIAAYSPASAVRYCQVIQQYAENKSAYTTIEN